MAEKDELLQAKERELAQVQQQLRSSEALVADFQKSLLQKDSELETLTHCARYLRNAETPPRPRRLAPTRYAE